MLAALVLRVPTAIQEQNATFGRANRFLARYVRFIFTSFKPEAPTQTTMHMGHIVRGFIEALYTQTPYPPPSPDDHFCLSIIGGSQGAKVLSTVVPGAIALLPPALQTGLRVYHQCRDEYAKQARHIYSQTQATVTLQPFFENMDALYRASHLMITRSGASTVAELCLTGRPAILVPFAAALEGDQTHNANYLARHDAAAVLPEQTLTAQSLATQIKTLMENPARLAELSNAVRSLATPKASQKLANYIAEKL
jgi:UDP-N-acetylglucosamine--N-acetylmuramyl-(pentapeptide) pyrophosphoryl-undecaprenol N-acetylglucosamine transferase